MVTSIQYVSLTTIPDHRVLDLGKGQPERHQAEQSADTKCRMCRFSSGWIGHFSKGKSDCLVAPKKQWK